MRLQGKITRWNDEQGFGFITPNGGGEAVFVHIKALTGRATRPKGGELVSYELARDAQGRRRAERVEYAGARTNPARRRRRNPLPVLLALAFLGALWGAVALGSLPIELAGLYLLLSVLTFKTNSMAPLRETQNFKWRHYIVIITRPILPTLTDDKA